MALSVSQVWELRTTGSDTNGGGFRAGASGTDYSQQNAAQIAVTDSVANGTATLTSATAAFAAAHVGNLIYLAGGSGSLTAVRREVISVTNATTIVLDAIVATGTGITLNLGGALLTLGELASSTRGMVAGNRAYVKSGTYAISASVTFAQSVGNPTNATLPTEIVGYKTTRGDITLGVNASSRPLVTVNGSSFNALTFSNGGWEIRNLVVAAGTAAPSIAIYTGGNYVNIANCAVTAYAQYGIYANQSYTGVHGCEVTGGLTGATVGVYTGQSSSEVIGCDIHDGVGNGVQAAGSGTVSHNVIANMTGATSDGIQVQVAGQVFLNTIYNVGRHGCSVVSAYHGSLSIKGNIFAKCGGYGMANLAGAGVAARREWDGNAFYSNTSGDRNNFDDTTVNPVNAVAPYTNVLDVLSGTLTVNPFTNAAGGDFTLNSTANGGALLRATGAFNAWPNLTQVGYRDFGAIQHQDAGGTTFTTFIEG